MENKNTESLLLLGMATHKKKASLTDGLPTSVIPLPLHTEERHSQSKDDYAQKAVMFESHEWQAKLASSAIVILLTCLPAPSLLAENLWYAANAIENLYTTAEAACAAYDMSKSGYPFCHYSRTEFSSEISMKCIHQCGNNEQNIINATITTDIFAFANKKNLGCATNHSAIGNPCNPATGNKYHSEIDNNIPSVSFTRSYNSQSSVDLDIGVGWSHTYARHLEVAGDTILVRNSNGQGYSFVASGASWETDADIKVQLNEVSSGGYVLQREDGTAEQYSITGLLQYVTHINGVSQNLIYDTGNRLYRVEVSTGEYLHFDYDTTNRVSNLTDHTNRTWSYRYDAAGNLEYVDNPDGTTKQYHYEDPNFPHALTGITDERGIRYATYGYDNQGRAILSTHADNTQRVDITYNNTDGTRTVTNSRGHASIYSTTVQLGVALVTDISGPGCSTCGTGNTSYQHDPANNNLLSKTENGVTTQYGDYDDKGQYGYKIEAVGTPEERRTDYSYDPRFFHTITSIEELSVASGQQKVTTYTYDDWGNRLTETINGFRPDGTPASRTTTWEYEGPLHQLSRIDGPRSDVADITTYDYYPNDPAQGPNRARLLRITDATGVAVRDQIQYTPTGKVMSESRPNGLTLAYTYYQGNDRLETLTESDGTSSRVTRWIYLATGEVESITQAHGSPDATALTFGYDDARRLTRVTDGLGNYIEYQLDTEGNQEAERIHDAGGILRKQLTQTFDLYNRLDTRTQANELIDQDMAPNGTLDLSTDGRGSVTDYGYDALKRLTQVVQDQGGSDPDTANATILYGYDAADRLTSVTDPIDGNTSYVYDDLGNLLSQVSPDTGTTTFTHDETGNISTRTDAKGQLFTYSHDALNRLILVDAPGVGDDIFYDYDTCQGGVGRLCRVSNADAIVQYQYDHFGNPTGLPGMQYAYDKAGRVRTLTYPSGARVTYHHDDAGQIDSVELTIDGVTQSLASNIAYTAFGPVTSLGYGNGLNLTQTFDTAYRMLSQDIPGVLALAYPQYDPNGNLTTRTRDGQNEGYGYDALDRLDNATGPFGIRDYTYDPNGNRTALNGTAYGYTSNSNRLAAIGRADVLLDDNGNTLNQGVWTFAYTAHNRLKAAHENGSLAATYAYNALGQRIRKRLSDGNGRHFLYGTQGELLAETDIDGNILNEYLYLNGQLLALYQPDDSGNGLTNAEEDVFGTNPANTDHDGDGLTDLDEWLQIGTDARNADTDGDGVLDGEEYAAGTDPTSAASYPGDGDVNQDGEVNVGDLLLVTQMALGQRTPTPDQLVRADINRDGLVDVVDVLLLQRRILGLAFLELFQELPSSQRLLAALDRTLLAFNSRVEGLQGSFIRTAQAATPNGKVYFVHNDHLGTPKVLTDGMGNVVWTASHDTFGMATVDEGPDGDGMKVVLNVRFPGQYYDAETGLHYNYFRTYDPGTGRYLESDPIGLEGGLNTYSYVGGNPLSRIDPSGLRYGCPPGLRPNKYNICIPDPNPETDNPCISWECASLPNTHNSRCKEWSCDTPKFESCIEPFLSSTNCALCEAGGNKNSYSCRKCEAEMLNISICYIRHCECRDQCEK